MMNGMMTLDANVNKMNDDNDDDDNNNNNNNIDIENKKKKKPTKKQKKREEQRTREKLEKEPTLIRKEVYLEDESSALRQSLNWNILFTFSNNKLKRLEYQPFLIRIREDEKLADGSFELLWSIKESELNQNNNTKQLLEQLLFPSTDDHNSLSFLHVSVYFQSCIIASLQINRNSLQNQSTKMNLLKNKEKTFESIKIKCCESSCFIQFKKQQHPNNNNKGGGVINKSEEEEEKNNNDVLFQVLFCINKIELLTALGNLSSRFQSLFVTVPLSLNKL